MKPAESAALIKSCLERGYVEHEDVFYPPAQAAALNIQPAKKSKKKRGPAKIYSDSVDMFCMLISQQLKVTIRMEYLFHPDRKWRFDYAIPEHKIAIEQEGGIWRKGGGAHSRPENIERDMEKYNEAAALGWKLIRRQPSELLTEETLRLIRANLQEKKIFLNET